jgi:DNA-binding response OmpR family regulator
MKDFTGISFLMDRRYKQQGKGSSMKILLIEDELDLQKAVKRGLEKKGYAVDSVSDGEEGLEQVFINDYDLLILDLNLPGIDGIEILKEIRRENKRLRILILSARSEIEDRITGLDLGANDYLIKPFHFDELDARVRNLLRREFIQKDVKLICGRIELDTARRCAYEDHIPLDLTRTEFSILEYLMHHRGQTVSAEQLMEHVYDSDADLFSNAMKVHIHSLRKKLSSDCIHNIRGRGYLIEEET